jgi:hypothetical protein
MPFSLNHLTFACSLKIKTVYIGFFNLILLMLLFSDPERSVNTSSFFIESSGYQCQDGIQNPKQHFSFLGDTQTLLHILQGVKASMYAKRGLKLLSHQR